MAQQKWTPSLFKRGFAFRLKNNNFLLRKLFEVLTCSEPLFVQFWQRDLEGGGGLDQISVNKLKRISSRGLTLRLKKRIRITSFQEIISDFYLFGKMSFLIIDNEILRGWCESKEWPYFNEEVNESFRFLKQGHFIFFFVSKNVLIDLWQWDPEGGFVSRQVTIFHWRSEWEFPHCSMEGYDQNLF